MEIFIWLPPERNYAFTALSSMVCNICSHSFIEMLSLPLVCFVSYNTVERSFWEMYTDNGHLSFISLSSFVMAALVKVAIFLFSVFISLTCLKFKSNWIIIIKSL